MLIHVNGLESDTGTAPVHNETSGIAVLRKSLRSPVVTDRIMVLCGGVFCEMR